MSTLRLIAIEGHESQRRKLKELLERETGYGRARDRSLARLREGMDLGTDGHIGWSRDSVHER